MDPIVTAVVSSVQADGTVTVDLGGGRLVAGCLVAAWWTPSSGTPVQVARRGQDAPWMVLGPTRTSNPTTVDIAVDLAFPFNVTPGTPTAANPLVMPAINAGSWRSGSWIDDPRQGAYTTAYGYYYGAYFYGAALDAVRGRSCTALTIRLSRFTSGGDGGPVPMWLALHAHPTRPGGQPYFVSEPLNVGGLAWGSVNDFPLPLAWGQALIEGRAHGIGHLYQGTANYAIMRSLAQDSTSGRLTLGWA